MGGFRPGRARRQLILRLALKTFIGHATGEVRSENGFLGVTVDKTFEDMPHPDIIVFSGGFGTRALMLDERVLDWVRAAHSTSTYTTSVCTGSLVLGAAGLLRGLSATTHWASMNELAATGAEPTGQRVVELLIDDTAAKACQLMIEYDPQPPFDAGAPEKVDNVVMTRVIEYASARE
ncbi:MAG: ThiJ/PfpI family protein [Ilumatobacteraceae bacterium]|nr:ThiJ/PfpI family protein [Ilumatobacteraceae bacterium]